MTNEELKIWFFEKYDNCYPIHKGNRIFMFYDKNFYRQRKLNRVLDKSEIIKEINPTCLFMVYDNRQLWCHYDEIWLFFYENYSSKYNETQSFIKKLLNEYDINLIPESPSMEYWLSDLRVYGF